VLLLSATASAETVYVKAARLFDGRSESVRSNVAVAVADGKIAAIVDAGAVPAGARLIDLGARTLMPGLIDTHTHIALHPGDYDAQILRETPELRTIWATVNARKTLEAGITAIRDLGNEGAGFADIALRDAIEKGLVPGPRILAAIRPVTSTGAYRLGGYSPYTALPPISSVADGASEVRREVRKLVEQGADVIKLYLESYEKRQLRTDMLSGAVNYSQDELNAAVEEAHRGGVRVAAHTYSDAAAKMAIEAGVDSIDHGLYLSEETFRRMAAEGIYYVPTLLVYELWRDAKIFGEISPANKAKLSRTVEEHTATFRRALKTPVRIAFGSDTFELPGTNAQELVVMVRYGMRSIDALRAATSTAAALLGIGDIGTIETGKAADLVAFEGDPLLNISAVMHPAFVMRAGRVILTPPGG
jgi:imidazolonepropionase-like amidohydrolase